MNVEFAEEHLLVIDLVERFVEDELMPLERGVLAREAAGKPATLLPEEEEPLLKKCQELGLWAMDVPEEVGGADLPTTVMMAIQERLNSTVTPFIFPPDSPNLHMLLAVANEDQKARYMEPYALGEMKSCIG